MAQEEWTTEPAGPSWLGRLVAPGSGRPGTVPFLALAGAVVAYVASLTLDWISATGTYTRSRSSGQDFVSIYGATVNTSGQDVTVVAGNNVTGLELLGLIYGLGGLALLSLGFAVLSRPELALRVRMAAAGLAVGVLGVVIAAAVRMPEMLLANGAVYAGGALATLSRSFQPGIFFAVAVAVLPVVAVWIRSAPAARAAVAAEAAGRGGPAVARPAVPDLPPASAFPAGPAGSAFPAGPAAAAGPGNPAGPTIGAHDHAVWSQRDADPGRWRRSAPPAPFDLTVTPDD